MRSANRELQNEKLLPTMGFEPGTFRLRSDLVKHSLLDQILVSIEHLKVERVLPVCAIKIDLYHVVDVVKCFVVYHISSTLYSQQTS